MRARASATRARIIPAHAGQTHRMQRGFMAGPDHPRACGANVHTAYQLRFPAGSSPRMRGKRLHDRCHRQRGRIIPAHAGQTDCRFDGVAGSADHPRACGANQAPGNVSPSSCGSSPRMRGKHVRGTLPEEYRRIIPAHAGQTRSGTGGHSSPTDHPRACGANMAGWLAGTDNIGSSPRMRGKRTGKVGGMGYLRIIPAHAGQTRSQSGLTYPATDHPRACGANNCCAVPEYPPCGSSPRMRGKRTAVAIARKIPRIIPAHAGQTVCKSRL